jgi:hypothetical protein
VKTLGVGHHLTEPNPQLAQQIRQTFAGMAHWAGTGPRGKHCNECQFWDHPRTKQRYACHRFFELTGRHGPRVPAGAVACRHFQSRETQP